MATIKGITYAASALTGIEQRYAANNKPALPTKVFKKIDLLLVRRQAWNPSPSVPKETMIKIIDA
jgi:hypothetical protein